MLYGSEDGVTIESWFGKKVVVEDVKFDLKEE